MGTDLVECVETVAWVVQIVIPVAPPSSLSPNARRRGNVWEQREATRVMREEAYYAARTIETRWTGGKVHIHEHVIWPKSKRNLPDPDSVASLCKPILDGIIDAGILPDDSDKYVATVTQSQERGTETTGQTIISITGGA